MCIPDSLVAYTTSTMECGKPGAQHLDKGGREGEGGHEGRMEGGREREGRGRGRKGREGAAEKGGWEGEGGMARG